MSNSRNQLCPASRATLVGAMVGGGAAIATQWKSYKEGELTGNYLAIHATKSAIQAAVISGVTTYVADKMAGRPALSLLTILSVGAAALYLADQLSGKDRYE